MSVYGNDWTFTRFYIPQAFDAGYRLADDAHVLWHAFEEAHNRACLPGRLEIPMESFVRAVEIGLKESEVRDNAHYRLSSTMWAHAVHHCGYVQTRHATGNVLATA